MSASQPYRWGFFKDDIGTWTIFEYQENGEGRLITNPKRKKDAEIIVRRHNEIVEQLTKQAEKPCT